jgi:hypothetical protein
MRRLRNRLHSHRTSDLCRQSPLDFNQYQYIMRHLILIIQIYYMSDFVTDHRPYATIIEIAKQI